MLRLTILQPWLLWPRWLLAWAFFLHPRVQCALEHPIRQRKPLLELQLAFRSPAVHSVPPVRRNPKEPVGLARSLRFRAKFDLQFSSINLPGPMPSVALKRARCFVGGQVQLQHEHGLDVVAVLIPPIIFVHELVHVHQVCRAGGGHRSRCAHTVKWCTGSIGKL